MHRLVSCFVLVLSTLSMAPVWADSVYSYSRSSSFEYDATSGLLTSETVEPNNVALCVKTTYQYDAYGNKIGSTTANCSGASGRAVFTSRSSSSSYAAQSVTIAGVTVAVPAGAFAGVVANALNQSESKTFDPRFGSVSSLTGPNALTANWQVDDFGRTVRESRADGTSSISAYCYITGRVTDTSSNSANCPTPAAAEIPYEAVSFVHSEAHDTNDLKSGPFSRVYLDAAGRKIRSVTEAFDGTSQPGGSSRLIVQDTDYSTQGTPLVATQPYFLDTQSSTATGSASYGMSTTVFDALGRPTVVYISDTQGGQGSIAFGSRGSYTASATRISYSGLVTKTTNDKGQIRIEEKNANGTLVRVTDALGAQIAFQHDAFDNLIQTRDALQNLTTVSYDTRGRKVSMSDPDTGLWQYDYDALGELVWQQSPNQRALSQATTMAYDVLGRMTQRVEAEYTSSWSYDTYADGSACNKGIGKLCASSTSGGIARRLVYDSFGRPVNSRTDISGGPSFATAVGYDSATGRVISQSWPTGLTVNYQYTGKGFLSTLTLATAATVNPLPATSGGTPGASTTLAAGSLLWQAQAYNAAGKAEQQQYGNGVIGKASFDALSGRVTASTAGANGATDVMNYQYAWDSLNHLTGRTDANGDGLTGAVTDNYTYDGIGRLQSYRVAAPAIPNLQRTVAMQYNALGSILEKSDVGFYSYPAQGAGAVRPHALQSVAGTFNSSYIYDANGNVITASAGGYRSIAYTSFNLPDSQNGLQGPSGGAQYTWQYDENHQRIKETRVDTSGTRITWMLHPDNAGGLSFESEQSGSVISNRHYLSAGGSAIGVLISNDALPTLAAGQSTPPVLSSITLDKVEYWHQDHLGSLVATTDHNGAVTARYAYDPFGKRRTTSGNYDANGVLVVDWNNTNSGTDRGFTGHEHLDDVGVIHMNGRLFDPRLGMFMQGDPFNQDPTNLQNFNRYGYCYNNPMTCTDPSGYLFYGMFSVPFFDNAWNNHIKAYVPVVAAIIVNIYMPGVLAGFGITGWESAAISGFVSGAVRTGSVKGGLQGMATAVMFYGAGKVVGGYADKAGHITNYSKFATAVALHGVVGCVSNMMGGGKCGPGALSAAFSKMVTPITGPIGKNDMVSGTVISAVVGGTASVLGGGKFSNGAVTASFSYIYNQCSMGECRLSKPNPFGPPPYQVEANRQMAISVERVFINAWNAINNFYDRIFTSVPPVPDVYVGDQNDRRAGTSDSGSRHTSGPLSPEYGGVGDAEKDFDKLTGGTGRPMPDDDRRNKPGVLIGDNGVWIRPGSNGSGPRIEIPEKGNKLPETLHY